MSKKRGKKKKRHFSSQERKARAARARKEFAQKLELVAEACGALDTYRSLPKKLKKFIADTRIDRIVLVAEDKFHPGRETLELIEYSLSQELSDNKIYLTPDNPPISLYDYSTAGWTLYANLKKNAHKIPGDSESILKQFSPIVDLNGKKGGINEIYGRIFLSLMLILSTFDKGYYFFKMSTEKITGDQYKYFLKILIKYVQPESTHISIDNIKRVAYRVGWAEGDKGVSWLSLRPSDLNLPTSIKSMEIPVYIQSHALIRLKERLDSVGANSILHHGVYEAIHNPKILILKSGTILMEYKLLNLKLGYLVLDFFEGMAVIRTFFFITQDRTPEGEKLKYLLGINKIDKKYWAIDKLSTYFSDELRTNSKLKSLFQQAGCSDLFKEDLKKLAGQGSLHSVKDLIQFLNLNRSYASNISMY